MTSVPASFAKSFKSSSHLLAGLPALHSSLCRCGKLPDSTQRLFLVHLSGFWVSIRKACRHFRFFCVSTQFVMLYVSIFHQFLSCFFLRIKSNILGRLLGLLCRLHHHRMKYCCLRRNHHVCCLLLEYPRLCRRHACLFLSCFWVSFFWMMRRSTLRCVMRSIFSCSFVVAHIPAPYVIVGATTAPNRCNRCRSKWSWEVNSCRCLANASDPVLPLGGFLVHECDHLHQIL